ncbi:hypothetical protein NCCP2165_03600 [Halomonas sp. NCCP-2165]|nr:hypothetical protein NCCP2165_03600 [Halomonas sp. NCCP-2165]
MNGALGDLQVDGLQGLDGAWAAAVGLGEIAELDHGSRGLGGGAGAGEQSQGKKKATLTGGHQRWTHPFSCTYHLSEEGWRRPQSGYKSAPEMNERMLVVIEWAVNDSAGQVTADDAYL